jgi:hypothetical protein
MEVMILTMINMINMSIDDMPVAPLIFLYNYKSTSSHHIQTTQFMGDGNLESP